MPVNVIHSIASFQFANVLYSLLPADLLDTVSPFHLALVEHGRPHDRAITIRFESLKSEKTPRNRAYYSNRHPTIELGNERRLVGFSRHAVKRIGERLAHGATLYEQAYEAFHFVENSQHFEMVTSREVEAEGGQEEAKQRGARTFTFYIEFEKLDGLYLHAQQVLGPLDKDRRYMMRVGYCPCVICEKVVMAKTLLYPGMRDTPERQALDSANLPNDIKLKYQQQVEHLTYRFACQDDGVELVKWLHHNACPQFIIL